MFGGGGGRNVVDYKKLIIEMLNKANDRQIQRIFHFIKAFLS